MNREMEAAFDDDDEDEDAQETQPLNPSPPSPRHARAPSAPGTYDFEAVDYASVPPPGTPPPHNRAFVNNWGNSNGVVPDTDELDAAHLGPSRGWFRRAAASVLPASAVRRWGLDYEPPPGAVGGGTNNDGVFANVTAKPGRTVEVREGDNIYLMPEDQQLDRPPSYQTAQLDAVPAYWETTVHAPSNTDTFGEMIIDALPSGTLFSFLWNMLISISFQFVGFLLTYLLHTTHAARFGSRAGLGVTLIQYGFALRERDSSSTSGGGLSWWGGDINVNGTDDSVLSHMNFGTKEAAEDFYSKLNITMIDGRPSGHISGTDPGNSVDEIQFANDMTTDWLSFFLMTIGTFPLYHPFHRICSDTCSPAQQAGSSCSRLFSASGVLSAGNVTSYMPRNRTHPAAQPPLPKAQASSPVLSRVQVVRSALSGPCFPMGSASRAALCRGVTITVRYARSTWMRHGSPSSV